jgi:hypothetical protein
LTIGLLFLFLLSVEYPFRNRNGVTAAPFIELSSIFERVDRAPRIVPVSSPPAAPASVPRE